MITARVATREHIREKARDTRKRRIDKQNNTVTNKRNKLNPCIFCQQHNHYKDQCNNFKSIQERKKLLKGRCFICFGDHRAKVCQKRKLCYHCKAPSHNSAICPKLNKRTATDEKKNFRQIENTTAMHAQCTQGTTFLQTAVTSIQGEKYRLLFDTGSQRSYITSRAARRLNLNILEDTVLTVYTFGSQKSLEIESPTVQLKLKEIEIRLNVVPFITADVVCPKLIPNKRNNKNIILADDGTLGAQVDILIGNNYYYTFMRPQRIQYGNHLYLVKSVFGWIWSGI